MKKLSPPYRKYILGARPTHAVTDNIHEAFEGITLELMHSLLKSKGYLSENKKPTKKAVNDGLIDACEGKALWNLEAVSLFLKSGGMNPKRANSNQSFEISYEGDKFVTLTVLSSYFNNTPAEVGRWLTKLGYRGKDGLPSKEWVKKGLAQIGETKIMGKQTKKVSLWELKQTMDILISNGYILDFDYEKSLKGRGRNSDVKVDSIDSRVDQFLREFVPLYNGKDSLGTRRLVSKTPKAILLRAEKKLSQKEGFLTMGLYNRRFQ